MTETKPTIERQDELFIKYGKLDKMKVAEINEKEDKILLEQAIRNIYNAATKFEIDAVDTEDVFGILSIYAYMFTFNPVEYITQLKASGASAANQEKA